MLPEAESLTSSASPVLPAPIFKSFWSGGFESAYHINSQGERLDLIAGTRHDVMAREDYLRLHDVRMWTARDAVRWYLVDRGPGNYEFASFLPMLRAAIETQTQVIWNLCHYGWPQDLDLFSTQFVDRFAAFAAAVTRVIRNETADPLFFAPINEISFFAWAASRDVIYPFATGRDNDIKQQLVRAGIAAAEAIWSVDPTARLLWGDPVIHVLSPHGGGEVAYNESQYEGWDMLCGRMHPSLGGAPKYLDIVGANYYHSNQWEHGKGRLRWEDEPRDPRWEPFEHMLERLYRRYDRPVYVAETSHFGAGRARWVREIGHSIYAARRMGVPVQGICLFPVIDRYDWLDREHWHHSGLFDVNSGNGYERTLNLPYAGALREVQDLLAQTGAY